MSKAQLKILKYLLLILVILWVVTDEFKKNWKVALIMLGFTALGLFLLMD